MSAVIASRGLATATAGGGIDAHGIAARRAGSCAGETSRATARH